MTSRTQNPPSKWPSDRKKMDLKRVGIDGFSEVVGQGRVEKRKENCFAAIGLISLYSQRNDYSIPRKIYIMNYDFISNTAQSNRRD